VQKLRIKDLFVMGRPFSWLYHRLRASQGKFSPNSVPVEGRVEKAAAYFPDKTFLKKIGT
jgi:hypothetical protein